MSSEAEVLRKLDVVQRAVRAAQESRGCLRPRDNKICHERGLPSSETGYDDHGRPIGWCEICWQQNRMEFLLNDLKQISQLNQRLMVGGHAMAKIIVKHLPRCECPEEHTEACVWGYAEQIVDSEKTAKQA